MSDKHLGLLWAAGKGQPDAQVGGPRATVTSFLFLVFLFAQTACFLFVCFYRAEGDVCSFVHTLPTGVCSFVHTLRTDRSSADRSSAGTSSTDRLSTDGLSTDIPGIIYRWIIYIYIIYRWTIWILASACGYELFCGICIAHIQPKKCVLPAIIDDADYHTAPTRQHELL